MILNAIQLENFKGVFAPQSLESLGTINTLIGPNNSGKTAVIQALTLIQQSLLGSADLTKLSSLLTKHDLAREISISLLFKLLESEREEFSRFVQSDKNLAELKCRWRFSWKISHGWDRGLLPTHCVLEIENHHFTVWEALSPGDLKVAEFLSVTQALNNPPLEPNLATQNAGNVNARLRISKDTDAGQFFMNLLLQFAQGIRLRSTIRQAEDKASADESDTLADDGKNLSQVLHTLRNNQVDTFDQLENAFREILAQSEAKLETKIEGAKTALKIVLGKTEIENDSLYFSELGFGTQQLLCLLTAAFTTPDGGLILVEEPEICLHADAQRRLAKYLSKHSEEHQLQLILTTHSTLFVPKEDDGSTYLVKWTKENGSNYSRVSSGELSTVRSVLGSRNADLFMKDGVVFWDGESEAVALPLIMRTLGYEEQLEGLWPINLRGGPADKRQVLREFLRYIKGSHVTPFVITDDDHGVARQLQNLVEEGLLPANNLHVWGRAVSSGPIPLSESSTNREFEDNFSDELLIQGANEQAEANGYEPTLKIEEFKLRQEQNTKKTSKLLDSYYHEVYSVGLDKPDLNWRIAQKVAEEIRQDPELTRQKYPLIRVLDKLINRVYPKPKEPVAEAEEPSSEPLYQRS